MTRTQVRDVTSMGEFYRRGNHLDVTRPEKNRLARRWSCALEAARDASKGHKRHVPA